MTFIVSLHCHDGIVMSADSQEGDGITKRYVHKLTCGTMSVNFALETMAPPESHPADWGYCLGGAGSAVTIDKFRDAWMQSLSQVKAFDHDQLEAIAETTLVKIRESYPDEHFNIMLALSAGAPPLWNAAFQKLRWRVRITRN